MSRRSEISAKQLPRYWSRLFLSKTYVGDKTALIPFGLLQESTILTFSEIRRSVYIGYQFMGLHL